MGSSECGSRSSPDGEGWLPVSIETLLREQFVTGFPVDGPVRAVGGVGVVGVGGDAQGVEHRRREVAGRDRVGQRIRRVAVGRAVHRSRRDARPGQHDRVARRPVLAARRLGRRTSSPAPPAAPGRTRPCTPRACRFEQPALVPGLRAAPRRLGRSAATGGPAAPRRCRCACPSRTRRSRRGGSSWPRMLWLKKTVTHGTPASTSRRPMQARLARRGSGRSGRGRFAGSRVEVEGLAHPRRVDQFVGLARRDWSRRWRRAVVQLRFEQAMPSGEPVASRTSAGRSSGHADEARAPSVTSPSSSGS